MHNQTSKQLLSLYLGKGTFWPQLFLHLVQPISNKLVKQISIIGHNIYGNCGNYIEKTRKIVNFIHVIMWKSHLIM